MRVCVRAGVEHQRTHYVLLHIFINVFISVTGDPGKTRMEAAWRRPHSLFMFISEGGWMPNERWGPLTSALIPPQMLTVSLITFPNLK